MNENRHDERIGDFQHGGHEKAHEHDIGAGQPTGFKGAAVTE